MSGDDPDTAGGTGWHCPDHGAVVPLWRPEASSYEAFLDHLERSPDFPTYLPWPLGPGWTVTDFGCVADRAAPGTTPVRATVTTCVGATDPDGVVEVTIVSEEPGTGLGRRVAGTDHDDPGHEVGVGPPAVRVRIEPFSVALWAVSTSITDVEFDRSVFAGEADGRWLWLVLRPASAALLLRDEWILADVARLGPQLVEMSFGGSPPAW